MESGRPTPTRMRWKSGPAQARLQRLQPVVARQPAAQAGADLAEGEVDLVVHHGDAVEVHAQAPRAGPTERPASFM